MIRFRVDDAWIEAREGQTILQALDAAGVLMNGVDVPHYCWHPKLSIDGSCRMCQVEVEGQPKLQIACNTPVADGMVVRTKTERVAAARRGVMELLLVNHPLDCPICDQAGECRLQDYAVDYGVAASRTKEPRRVAKKNVDLGPTIVLDQERCILCRRCVRFCREVPKTGELSVFGRGDRSVLDVFPGDRLDNAYSMNVADICPVGALTTKDFRFKVRVWFLEDVPSVCTGCSRGCNAWLGVAKGRVQRMTPRRNDDVNDTWLCDAGRLSYHLVHAPDRLDHALVRDATGALVRAGVDDAVETAAERLRALVAARGAGVLAFVLSAHATNEALFAFRELARALGAEHVYFACRRGEGDELLVLPEKAPNAEGARALGLEDAERLLPRLRGGGVDGLVVLGDELLADAYLGGFAELARIDTVVALATHRSDIERAAHVVLPVCHAAESRGTLTNHARRVQALAPAVAPPGDARDAGAFARALGAALAAEGFARVDGRRRADDDGVAAASRALADAEPAFAGIHVDVVGAGGRVLGDG
ncbi:MAG: 2Fe-2S iron-sulfur cluster-binding protein [Myxococcota bacterium]